MVKINWQVSEGGSNVAGKQIKASAKNINLVAKRKKFQSFLFNPIWVGVPVSPTGLRAE